jgi:hypothetical protein
VAQIGAAEDEGRGDDTYEGAAEDGWRGGGASKDGRHVRSVIAFASKEQAAIGR